MASISYDQESNALYFRLAKSSKKTAKTIPLGNDRFLDLDKNGKIIGFEILFARSIPQEAKEAILRSKSTIELLQ
ncbi:MAG: DUF2283 domain-containing protein [Thaumarchaeota archaeon]|nr:DUF2283 domain-containing protein [Nitrososphaerota archaeon]MBI3641361.1 DUF2283 domain-containing protein [Nitrososphaerota archaeon]